MAKLTAAQQKQLDELQALAEAPDEYEPPETVHMEVAGAIVEVPYRDAKRFLKKNGIDLDEVLEEEMGEGEAEEEEEEEEEDEGEGEGVAELPRVPRKKSAAKAAAEPVIEKTRSQKYFRKGA